MRKIAIYPGSFDPVTNGHLDIVERAAKLFDRVIVGVVRNPDKKPLFTTEERVKMLLGSVSHFPNVVVDSFDGLLVHYLEKKHAQTIIRGLRAVSDFDFEFQIALFNRRMKKDAESLFMMTDYKYTYLSSSLVKQIALLGGSVDGLVPHAVEKLLQSKRRKK